MSVRSVRSTGIELHYEAARATEFGLEVPACVYVYLDEAGYATLQLTMDDARVLAEMLPGLVMAHDATEHAAAEHAAAVAESKAA
ncbi:hypothetical protein [Nocardia sp. NBC_00403]|uniref:hypothetical protein n=1 Tax=Nocardia sp. NBC_00403 TaxID=2975990 RepID=UPI002E1BB5BA